MSSKEAGLRFTNILKTGSQPRAVRVKVFGDADPFFDTMQELKVCGGEGRRIHVQKEVFWESVSKFTGRRVIVHIEDADELPRADLDGRS